MQDVRYYNSCFFFFEVLLLLTSAIAQSNAGLVETLLKLLRKTSLLFVSKQNTLVNKSYDFITRGM